ncbi:hypothetical protein N0V85_009475 [Neurospora sp. IMI 360204]|nr:hypothetical protein N0V85_009475 [Neurospora sp. IMI 360204]
MSKASNNNKQEDLMMMEPLIYYYTDTEQILSDLNRQAEIAKQQRLEREGRDPRALAIFEAHRRDHGYVLRPFKCPLSTTDGWEYERGLKALPGCLIEDQECWRALLDPWKTTTGKAKKEQKRGRKENFDRWVEKGNKSVVLCVADKMDKCRGVMVRWRIDSRMDKEKEVEADGVDLRLDVSKSGRSGNGNGNGNEEEEEEEEEGPVWKEGVLGLKVIDFWRPGVADEELQAALGDATRDIFELELLDDVKAVQIHGGAGPSMSGNVEYPIDARMRRYLEMEENVKRLAIQLGYQQIDEEQKPMGTRWVLEFPRDALDELVGTMAELSMDKTDEEELKEEERKNDFEMGAEEQGKIVREAGFGGAKYVEDVSAAVDLVDSLIIAQAEQRGGLGATRNRHDGYRPMPMLTGNLPVRNRENPSSSGSENYDWNPWEASPESDGEAILESIETDSPESGGAILESIETDSPESGEVEETRLEAIPEESTMPELKAGTSPKPDQAEESRSEGDNMSSPEIATLFRDEKYSAEKSPFEDADEGNKYHLSGSHTPENKTAIVESVEVDTEKAESSLDGKKDVGVSVKSVDPSDEDASHDESSDDEIVDLAVFYSSGNENDLD